MKKLFAISCFILTLLVGAQAQSIENIVKALKDHPSLVHQNLNMAEIMSVARTTGFDTLSQHRNLEHLKSVDSMEVYSIDDCDVAFSQKMSALVDQLKSDKDYESILSVTDKDENVEIFSKKTGDTISELDILVIGETNIAVVRMLGRMTLTDIRKMMEDNMFQGTRN